MSDFWNAARPFVIGGISGCCATLCIQPIDITKVRIQAINEAKGLGQQLEASTNPLKVFLDIARKEGASGLYVGLGAGLLRQVTYATTRLGLFKTISDKLKERNGGKNISFNQKLFASFTAGFVGALVGNPADLSLIRFQTDSMLPVEERRNYKNVWHAMSQIVKNEGFLGLWGGATPTVVRALLINMGMLASFDEIKERLNETSEEKNTLKIRAIASGCSGVIASVLSLPGDNIKTKLQKMKAGPDGKLPYTGVVDCFKKSIQREGVSGLWVGLPTFIIRISPHVIITLIIQDYLTQYCQKLGY